MAYLLAIESSCDDTSVAIISQGKVLANLTSGQSVHEQYGGIVPELASREHQKNIIPLTQIALEQTKLQKNSLDAIAFTAGPGLLGSLLVGTVFSKSLALALDKPLIPVDHLHGHLMSLFIDEPSPAFPFLCLLVSGGHTMIVRMDSPLEFEVLGQTMDDAAGEAYDKGAKILGLPYPGGPVIDKKAAVGNADRFAFPEPKIKGLNFSYSGLKTSLLYKVRDNLAEDDNFIQKNLNDLCASYQKAINTLLVRKVKKAVKVTGIREIAVAGGVAANSGLQQLLRHMADKENANLYIPDMKYCLDNAAMIGIVGWHKFMAGRFGEQTVVPYAKSPLKLRA